MVQIGSKSSVLADSVVAVLSMGELRDKSFLQRAYADGKLYAANGCGEARSVVLLRNGTIIVTSVSAETLRTRVQAALRPVWE